MLLENTPFSYLVEFSTGTPTGVFSYSLSDDEGNPVAGITNVEVTIPTGGISTLIQIPQVANTLTKPLFEGRTISWFYPTSGGVVNGSYSYQIQKRVPFPCTYEGVRTKLGIDTNEIPDERIDLLMSYIEFNELFTNGLDAYTLTGDATSLKITNAIEAVAALKLLPTLQLSLAKRLSSGTNEYERWTKIDWDVLRADLEQLVYNVTVLIDPDQVYLADVIFTLGIRSPDPFTGGE